MWSGWSAFSEYVWSLSSGLCEEVTSNLWQKGLMWEGLKTLFLGKMRTQCKGTHTGMRLHWGIARPGWGVGMRGNEVDERWCLSRSFQKGMGRSWDFIGRAVASHWMILSRVAWSDIFLKRIVSKQLENGCKACKCVGKWVRVEARGLESRLLAVVEVGDDRGMHWELFSRFLLIQHGQSTSAFHNLPLMNFHSTCSLRMRCNI